MIIQPPGWYDKRNLSKFVLCILPGKDRGMKTLWRTFERRTTKRNLQRRGIMKERRKDKHVIVTKDGRKDSLFRQYNKANSSQTIAKYQT